MFFRKILRKTKKVLVFRKWTFKKFEKASFKFAAVMLLVAMNVGILNIPIINAFYGDQESSIDNTFSAGHLDITLSNTDFEGTISNDPGDKVEFQTTVAKMVGNLPTQYEILYEKVSGDDNLCNALNLEASRGVINFNGALTTLYTGATTDFGLWNFALSVLLGQTVSAGEKCSFDLIFRAWIDGVPSVSESGFWDEERLHVTINANSQSPIVLNEFLPNPDGILCADGSSNCSSDDDNFIFDFGKDSDDKPKGEWVELFNLTSNPIDVNGWYLQDASGGVGNTQVTSLNSIPSNATVPANGYLVVYMNKPVWNNTGDVVKLFSKDNVLMDSYAYSIDYDYCVLIPTPGETNIDTSDPDATCSTHQVPGNKSYARIPDGTGPWIDPIPTPGISNLLKFDGIISSTTQMQINTLPISSENSTTTATTTLEIITETASSTVEIIETEPVIEPEIIIIEPEPVVIPPDPEIILTPSPSQGEGGGEVIGDPIVEPTPIELPPAPELPPSTE